MFNWLNANTLQGVLRAILSFGGGILVGKGALTTEQLTTITQHVTDPSFIGACMAVMTGVWSVIHKQTPVVTTSATSTTTTAAPISR